MTKLTELSGKYVLDPVHSRLGFSARHAMVTKVRGNFDEFEGTGIVNGADPAASSVEVTIQAASINTNNQQRDNHVRSGDFLGIDQYPTITFKSTSIAIVDDEHIRIDGDLTIKGNSKPISIDFEFTGAATDARGYERIGFEGSTSINRQEFGVTWNAAMEAGGVMVSDKVNIDIEVSAIKQQEQ